MTQKSHSKIYHKANETLAQLAEHTPFKRRVEGSNPSYLTTTGKRGNHFDFLAFFVDADI